MIPPIQPLPPLPSTPGAGAAGGTAGGAGGAGAAGASGSGGFAQQVGNAINQVQQAQTHASSLEASAAAGQGNVTDAMLAATQAQLETQVTVALTNKAISAFNSVMSLQI